MSSDASTRWRKSSATDDLVSFAFDLLKARGFLKDVTDEPGLRDRLDEGPVTFYTGYDPTADSLHVGNLVPLIALRRFQNDGHNPIALAGGATGSIGDPSGKKSERQLLTKEVLDNNIASVKEQLAAILDFSEAILLSRTSFVSS